jgi:hypothetical protein
MSSAEHGEERRHGCSMVLWEDLGMHHAVCIATELYTTLSCCLNWLGNSRPRCAAAASLSLPLI